jgi:hypothetical protein
VNEESLVNGGGFGDHRVRQTLSGDAVMKLSKFLTVLVLSLMFLFFFSYVYVSEDSKIATGTPEKILILKGTLIQQDGTPAANVRVYMQKAFFPDNDRNNVRTEFTTNQQGQLSMPFDVTDKQGNFSVAFHLQQIHFNFALSLRQGRASMDFPIIKIFELTEEVWKKEDKRVFNVGKLSLPKGWDISHFERGAY